MKRLFAGLVFVLSLMLAVSGVAAQASGEVMPLNDATPAIDIIVTPQPGASGALSLDLSGASVLVNDAAGQVVLQMADKRVHQLELRFGPSSSTYTVTLERLPGLGEAYVSATPIDDLTAVASYADTNQNNLQIGQGLDALISSASTVDFTVPAGAYGRLVSSFAGGALSGSVVDATGVNVARLNPSLIDGISLTLEGGNYAVNLASADASVDTQTAISVTMSAAPVLPQPMVVSTVPATPAPQAVACTIQLTAVVEVRTGPGTTYSLLGRAPRGITLLVGGVSPQRDWILVGDGQTSGWVQGVPGQVAGDCTQVPTLDVAAPQSSVAPAASAQNTTSATTGEHEDGADEAHESGHDD